MGGGVWHGLRAAWLLVIVVRMDLCSRSGWCDQARRCINRHKGRLLFSTVCCAQLSESQSCRTGWMSEGQCWSHGDIDNKVDADAWATPVVTFPPPPQNGCGGAPCHFQYQIPPSRTSAPCHGFSSSSLSKSSLVRRRMPGQMAQRQAQTPPASTAHNHVTSIATSADPTSPLHAQSTSIGSSHISCRTRRHSGRSRVSSLSSIPFRLVAVGLVTMNIPRHLASHDTAAALLESANQERSRCCQDKKIYRPTLGSSWEMLGAGQQHQSCCCLIPPSSSRLASSFLSHPT